MKTNDKLIALILEGMVIFKNYIDEEKENIKKQEHIKIILDELIKALIKNNEDIKETNNGKE